MSETFPLTTGVGSMLLERQKPPWGGQPAHPQYANYWAPLTRKRHTMPHSAQSQHTNYWAPRTRKRHQQEHRPQRPTESSDPTQHAKGRTGDRPGPRKGATTRRNVTQGGYGIFFPPCPLPPPNPRLPALHSLRRPALPVPPVAQVHAAPSPRDLWCGCRYLKVNDSKILLTIPLRVSGPVQTLHGIHWSHGIHRGGHFRHCSPYQPPQCGRPRSFSGGSSPKALVLREATKALKIPRTLRLGPHAPQGETLMAFDPQCSPPQPHICSPHQPRQRGRPPSFSGGSSPKALILRGVPKALTVPWIIRVGHVTHHGYALMTFDQTPCLFLNLFWSLASLVFRPLHPRSHLTQIRRSMVCSSIQV